MCYDETVMGTILEDLNPAQRKAVLHKKGPALVVAGPGSGKTRVLTHRAAYLIRERGIRPENVLLVTFTNKAAGEMKGRISKLLSSTTSYNKLSQITTSLPPNPLPWSGTFHATCARILRREGYQLGISPNYAIYDTSDSKTAIKQALKELSLLPNRFSPAAVLITISRAKDELLDEYEFAKYAYGLFQEGVAKVYFHYQKILRKNDALDFADLIMKTVLLFRESPQVLEKYQRQFVHILVDEYQDTNHAQYTLTKLLAAAHKEIFIVGDMSQAIYSFRGADFRNILNFEKDYPEAKIYNLEQNYRSTKTILLAAREVIKSNQTHIPLNLWTKNDQGTPIKLYKAMNEKDEAFHVVKEVTDNARRSLGGGGSNLNRFAVLYRTNAQSRAIEEVFLRSGVPYKLIGGIKFYERKEIKDVLSYLRLIQNPKDSISLERVKKLGQVRFRKFQVLQNRYDREKISTSTTPRILEEILERTGYLEYLDNGTEEGLTRVENVKELRSVAAEFPDLPSFLENVALVQNEYLPSGQAKAVSESKEAVTLMTLHAAKGLEFPTVFIVGMEEGLFPHSRSLVNLMELEEERRLCYVGMTRAMRELHLTFSQRRLYFGARQANIPSRFLSEIPEDLLEARFGDSV